MMRLSSGITQSVGERKLTLTQHRILAGVSIAAVLFFLAGCATPTIPEPTGEHAVQPMDLSGDWEYQDDGTIQKISLDKRGNGRYTWQDGRFLTTSFSSDQWEGRWYQGGNDREGEFRLKLTGDGKEAEGTWWYTRIGDKQITPHEQGGRFHLRRLGPPPPISSSMPHVP
jgi:hypothetical protein